MGKLIDIRGQKMNVKGTYCCDRSDARYIESGYCDGYEDAKRKYEPRWRNIEEELPQEAGDVIIYTDHVMAGHYAWGKWFDDKNNLVTPTYWMPWPSAPKKCHNENHDYAECDQFVCSNCGIELQDWHRVERDEDDGDVTYHEYEFKFCPNCGAKIDERKSE